MSELKIVESASVQDLVEEYNRVESERLGYPFKSQWIVESDDSLLATVGDLVAAAEARGYRKAIEALRDVADKIDRGPTFPVSPAVISALIREHAEDLAESLASPKGEPTS
jgi:hypothetical protein